MTVTRIRPTQILVVLALTNLISYAARNALFAVYPDLTARYGIDDSEIGLLQTVFMIPHAAATLGFGWAGDRFDRRRVIVVGILIASVAGAVGALGSSYLGLAASRAFVGFGTAAVVPVANSILAEVFDGPMKASRIAIFNLGLFLGGVAGFATGMALGFPLVVVVIALPGLVFAALIWHMPIPTRALAKRDDDPATSGFQHQTIMLRHFIRDARVLLRIRTLRWLIVSTTVMAFAAGGYNAWLKEFLVRDKLMTDAEATTLLTLSLCGGLTGILVGGRVSDLLGKRFSTGRLWTIVVGMILTAPCAAIAIMLPKGAGLDLAGIATLFFISWYHAPVAATVDDLAPRGLSVAAQGLVIFMMHMIGTAPSSWVVGQVSEMASLHDAMWVPTGALIVAAVAMAIATLSFAADRAAAGGTRAQPRGDLEPPSSGGSVPGASL
ncbi:MAG: MFS transporter [Deltaproteobacteria bacterium]|nr:MFS transporter [Deltaproteobacteria bacterium]MDQ3298860.1 MFS transporter [Myxococcota bacterium]